MVDRKKVESAVQNLAESMERVANQPETNKHKKRNKEKIKKVISGISIAIVLVGGSGFLVYAFNNFLDQEHERFKNDVRQEIKNALAENQKTTDTVIYKANQKTK